MSYPPAYDGNPNETGAEFSPTVTIQVKEIHPLLQALIDALPEVDAPWSVLDRANWLKAAAEIFGVVYQRRTSMELGDRIRITIETNV